MDFERGKDVKEQLKLGRKANAFRVRNIRIHGRIPGKWREYVEEKYKRTHPPPYTYPQFHIYGDSLEFILRMMEKSGISKELDNHIKSLITKKHKESIERAIKTNGHSENAYYDISKVEIMHINFEIRSKSIYLEDKQILLTATLGKDVLYKRKLYRIKNEF